MTETRKNRSSERRKDYVTFLAIGLFAFIVILELMLVTWLPRQLASEALWSKDVALAELVDLEDTLRKNIKYTLKFRNKWDEGESKMALDTLNDIAKYLRHNQQKMSKKQIRDLYTTLMKFETRYNKWMKRRFCIKSETIDIKPILQKTLDKYNNDTDRKSTTEDNNILFQG